MQWAEGSNGTLRMQSFAARPFAAVALQSRDDLLLSRRGRDWDGGRENESLFELRRVI